MKRTQISSGSPYEEPIGFSRAVRIGHMVAVAGTAPIAEDGQTACPGDLHGQTRRCLEIILAAVVAAGGRREDIIRTRVMLTDIDRWKEAGRAHGEFFGEIRPACTFVEVSRFIDPAWLVEMEADAVVADGV
ncbi:MAG: RidA family protein [Desulfosarcinaceae bacterium]|nr:RidA family protein [Desulfosarcinaceae bacterium]